MSVTGEAPNPGGWVHGACLKVKQVPTTTDQCNPLVEAAPQGDKPTSNSMLMRARHTSHDPTRAYFYNFVAQWECVLFIAWCHTKCLSKEEEGHSAAGSLHYAYMIHTNIKCKPWNKEWPIHTHSRSSCTCSVPNAVLALFTT